MPRDYVRPLERLEQRRAEEHQKILRLPLRRQYGGMYPPVKAAAIRTAEQRLGFALPPLLRAIYRNLANGGFGPGYGLYGLEGGYPGPNEDNALTLAELHAINVSDPEAFPWPPKLLVIAHGGCLFRYAVDCSNRSYPVLYMEGLDGDRIGTFDEVMERWADGQDLLRPPSIV